jgi:hypothetical protein
MFPFRPSRRPAMTGATLLLMLTACQSGPPAPEGVPGAATNLLTVEATSSTSLRLSFDGTLGDNQLDVSSYVVTAPSGAPLKLLGAHADSEGKKIDLATSPQQNVPYVLTFKGLTNASGKVLTTKTSVTGSVTPAPVLRNAVPLSNTQLVLTFIDPATGSNAVLDDSATEPSNYRIAVGTESTATSAASTVLRSLFASTSVAVEKIRISDDRSSVVLTTAPMPEGAVQVSAAGVRAKTESSQGAPALVDPFQSTAEFTAVAAVDRARPTITRVTSLSNTTVQVLFSEALTADAADLTHYVIRDTAGAPLAVARTELSEFRTAVILTTSPQTPMAQYTVEATGLVDMANNPLDLAASHTSFNGTSSHGPGASDITPPRVVNAGATSNTTVQVSFSEPLQSAGAEDPTHYRITGVSAPTTTKQTAGAVGMGGVNPQTITLDVTAARLVGDGSTVELTTRPQSDVKYEVAVSAVKDRAGNPLAPPERGVDPSRATFVGLPAGGTALDTDSDGLSDADEMRGWTIRITDISGAVKSYEVTSDPTRADTDGDGLGDRDEKTYQTNPRTADSDDDQISDNDELNVYYTTPNDADSDNDTLGDGLEINFFKTSPLLDDTDGDQLKDWQEVISSVRNPRIADLPLSDIEIGGVDLRLDTRITATSDKGSRTLETKSASTTLQDSQSTSTERADTHTSEWFAKAGVEVGGFYNWGISEGIARGGISVNVSAEAGGGGSDTTTFTRSSVEASQREYATTLSTDKEVTVNESVTREVVGADLAVGLTVKNAGNITFTIRNLEVTALMPDPRHLGSFIPVATLRADGADGITVGPFSPSRGPFRFKATQVFPSLVEQLMQDPKGLIFRVVNYDLTDELGRNFAYTSQQINERTAQVVIDYGGAWPEERYRVATSSTFDASGRPAGRSLQSIMEDVLGLKHYDASADAGLSPAERHASYSTKMVDGVEVLWRVRELSKDDPVVGAGLDPKKQRWFVIRDNTLNDALSFGPTVVQSGQTLRLVFNQDLDGDGLTYSEEQLYGTSDKNTDSDDDSIPDAEELYGPLNGAGQRQPLTTEIDGQLRPLRSNPIARDSDGDGLSDCQELHPDRCPMYKNSTTPPTAYTHQLDPSDADTDGDSISDGAELAGYTITSLTGSIITVYSDPFKTDSDGDLLPDDVERILGTNPGVADRDYIADDDGDGLTNDQEMNSGWQVKTVDVNGMTTTRTVHSDKSRPDSDGDGLDDRQERQLGLDPTRADTDGDGMRDPAEVTLTTNPLDADTDNDLRSDGDEVDTPWLVYNVPVYSSPLLPDEDGDGLNDLGEKTVGTNPKKRDTDEDGTSDGAEVTLNATIPVGEKLNPLAKDKRVRVTYLGLRVDGSCDGDDDTELRGRLGEFWNASQNEYYMIPDDASYQKDTYYRFPDGLSRAHTMLETNTLKLLGWYMYEYDSGTDDDVTAPSADVKFNEVTEKLKTATMDSTCKGGTGEGDATIHFEYKIEWLNE